MNAQSSTTPATPAAVGSGGASFAARLKGQSAALPPRVAPRQVLAAGLGGVLAIGLVAGATSISGSPMVLGSFGASCVLMFGFPDSPFSQPRNVVLGHFLSSFVGLAVLSMFGAHGWAMALAAGAAIMVMLATRTVHPPAGSNPVIIFLTQPGWSFLLLPTLAGALILVAAAALYLNLTTRTAYPRYWVGRDA